MSCLPLTGIAVPEVSSVHSAGIFRATNTEDKNAMVQRNVGNYNSDTMLQSSRFITLPDVMYRTLTATNDVSACDYQLPPQFVLCVFRSIYTCKSSVVVSCCVSRGHDLC